MQIQDDNDEEEEEVEHKEERTADQIYDELTQDLLEETFDPNSDNEKKQGWRDTRRKVEECQTSQDS
jgi:hypothetical protein